MAERSKEESELLYRISYYTELPSPYGWFFSSLSLMDLECSSWETIYITRYKAKKYIKKWLGEGIIAKVYVGGQDEDGYVHCVCGYAVTEKAKDLSERKKAHSDVIKEITDEINQRMDEYGI